MTESTLLRACDVARATGFKVNTIRAWAHRGLLAARDHDEEMRPLYGVDDVLAVHGSHVAKRDALAARRRAKLAAWRSRVRQPRQMPRQPVVTYNSVHQRLKRDRGPASAHVCNQCGELAKDWAYDHGDPAELMGKCGPYSLDPNHYRPLCRVCHKAEDQAARARRTA